MDGGHPAENDQSADCFTESLRRTYNWSTTAPSVATIEALADLENVEPTELATAGTTLYHHVDPEALDTLVQNRDSGEVTVTVSIDGYHVRFDDNMIVVSEGRNPEQS